MKMAKERNMYPMTEPLIAIHSVSGALRYDTIPANFFWDISVRVLSWDCWDFWRRHDHFRRFPKKSEVFRRSPKFSDPKSAEGKLAPSAFHFKKEGIVIYSFYTWFSFLTWVWVNICLEIVSSKTATTHIFQSGVRNWPASVSRREIEVFNPQAWELAGIWYVHLAKVIAYRGEDNKKITHWDIKIGDCDCLIGQFYKNLGKLFLGLLQVTT